MNYREKKKKDSADKKVKKLSAYYKKYETEEAADLKAWMEWEEAADREIVSFQESTPMLPEPEDDLYMAGWIGGAGTQLLGKWKNEELAGYFPIAFLNTLRDRELFRNLTTDDEGAELKTAGFYIKEGASWVAPVGEGGLMKALYRLGKESGLGFRVLSREVPIRQITIEFCEFLLLHPWELLTGASFLFTAKPNRIDLEQLEKRGMVCRKIGRITKEKQKVICRGEEESNINRPDPDALLNLLNEEV